MMKKYLLSRERTIMLKELNKEQKKTLFLVIGKSYRAYFADVLAKYKGTRDWAFYYYIDHGRVRQDIRCECGRPLRHQYVLINKKTKKKRNIGSTHLIEELRIPADIAKEVLKGINDINYDLDELLQKFYYGWELPTYLAKNIDEINVPNDIKELLAMGLPLLSRQLDLLYSKLSKLNTKNQPPIYIVTKTFGRETYEYEIKHEEIYKILIGKTDSFSYIDKFRKDIEKFLKRNSTFYISDLIHYLAVHSELPYEKVNGEHALITHFRDYLVKRGHIKE